MRERERESQERHLARVFFLHLEFLESGRERMRIRKGERERRVFSFWQQPGTREEKKKKVFVCSFHFFLSFGIALPVQLPSQIPPRKVFSVTRPPRQLSRDRYPDVEMTQR